MQWVLAKRGMDKAVGCVDGQTDLDRGEAATYASSVLRIGYRPEAGLGHVEGGHAVCEGSMVRRKSESLHMDAIPLLKPHALPDVCAEQIACPSNRTRPRTGGHMHPSATLRTLW